MDQDINTRVLNTVKVLRDPYAERSLGELKWIKAVNVEQGVASVELELGYPAKGARKEFEQILSEKLIGLEGIKEVRLDLTWNILSHAVQRNLKPIKTIKNIIAVASGKGGVGKSTTAVNIALALVAEGARVGILDADIYGPSQPRMLGLSGKRPETPDGKSIDPLVAYGLECMSIGFMVDEEEPMIWRGPMVTSALNQLIGDTNWGDLDYLVVDMPPGTGDIALTLSQQVPVSGAVIVTTPQDIALLDARKGLKMFEKVSVPVLGVVENMSTHICSQCGHEEHIFGSGGGASMADQYGVPLLGSLPLDIRIREEVDSGQPTVVADPEGLLALRYREIARSAVAKLAAQGRDYSRLFPKISIENS
ncbi:MAG: iron-sulfur cluster carrier protein ApbC [Gammaproteobacteria bacterium]|jgi:ATP-binding protein involved in chromosome partitioning|nr:iron-sulfur cluster carrier protein ApbC [Gammaproteobacteria bacterium]